MRAMSVRGGGAILAAALLFSTALGREVSLPDGLEVVVTGVPRPVQLAIDGRTLVVLSNYATEGMRTKCFELGADRVFDKSNDIEALLLYCQQLARGDVGNTVPSVLQ